MSVQFDLIDEYKFDFSVIKISLIMICWLFAPSGGQDEQCIQHFLNGLKFKPSF